MEIMDAVSFHSLWTLILFVCFIGIVFWAYSGKRKASFDKAANLVFADDEMDKKKQTGEDK